MHQSERPQLPQVRHPTCLDQPRLHHEPSNRRQCTQSSKRWPGYIRHAVPFFGCRSFFFKAAHTRCCYSIVCMKAIPPRQRGRHLTQVFGMHITTRNIGAPPEDVINVRTSTTNAVAPQSHLILSVNVRGVNRHTGATFTGRLHLIDLAGSERVSKVRSYLLCGFSTVCSGYGGRSQSVKNCFVRKNRHNFPPKNNGVGLRTKAQSWVLRKTNPIQNSCSPQHSGYGEEMPSQGGCYVSCQRAPTVWKSSSTRANHPSLGARGILQPKQIMEATRAHDAACLIQAFSTLKFSR